MRFLAGAGSDVCSVLAATSESKQGIAFGRRSCDGSKSLYTGNFREWTLKVWKRYSCVFMSMPWSSCGCHEDVDLMIRHFKAAFENIEGPEEHRFFHPFGKYIVSEQDLPFMAPYQKPDVQLFVEQRQIVIVQKLSAEPSQRIGLKAETVHGPFG